jgi:truncated hemoglobin YjbI
MVVLTATLMMLALPTVLGAAPPPDATALDKQLSETLKDVHNRGADLFNGGDPAGCYRIFQGLLWTVRPLLGQHPELQREIDAGMARAEGLPTVNRRALALHEVIESVRGKLSPAKKPDEKKPDEIKPQPKPGTTTGTLWDRLGGEAKVRDIVESFVIRAASDPKVNFTRNGKSKFTAEQLATFKTRMVEFISQATGGPLKYSGKSMKEVHKGMGITEAEFNQAENDLRAVLETQGVKPADVKAVLEAVEGTRKDIVEPLPTERKPEEKKPSEKGTPTKGQ